MVFFTALKAVFVLLLIAIPGYLLMKKRMLSADCIPGFSKVLIYVTQPCLAVYTFKSVPYSPEKLLEVGIFALLAAVLHALVIGVAYLVFRRNYKKTIWRVMTMGVVSANCAFFGIPIIEALLPSIASDLIIFTTVYATVMNVFGWTIGSAILSGDMRYMSLKKMLTTPALVGTAVALVLFVLEIPIFPELNSMVTTAARMATPLSMIIMGMRLATMRITPMFTNPRIYLTVAIKQILVPLVAFAMLYFLPISSDIKCSFYIISACPIASVVLNYAEIVGEGQGEAANMVLLSTVLSIATLPVMVLLLPLLQ